MSDYTEDRPQKQERRRKSFSQRNCKLFEKYLHLIWHRAIIVSVLNFKEVSFLEKHYGRLIRVLHWCTDQTMSDTLAQMDLTAAQGHIVGYLSHQSQPPCARDIAEAFQLSNPTVSGLLSRLERKGFIEFRTDPRDRRSRRIYLLPKGLECHKRIEETILANEQRLVQGFTAQERQQFMELLDRAIHNMGGSPCQPPCVKKEE